MDSEFSRGNFEVGFRPQKSVRAGREQLPEAGEERLPDGGLAVGSEAVARPARPQEGGPSSNPGLASVQSCSPGWCSAFYEADCFGADVYNYVKELARQKAGGSLDADAQSPVSPGLLSTVGPGGCCGLGMLWDVRLCSGRSSEVTRMTEMPSLCPLLLVPPPQWPPRPSGALRVLPWGCCAHL